MKFTLNNIGTLKSVEIAPKPLTIFCGSNNTGKTYAMYVLWEVLHHLFSDRLPFVEQYHRYYRFADIHFPFVEEIAENLIANGIISIHVDELIKSHWKEIEKVAMQSIKRRLPRLFGASEQQFENTTIDLMLNIDEILDLIIASPIHDPFQTSDNKIVLDFTKEAHSTEMSLTLAKNTLKPSSLLSYLNQFFLKLLFLNRKNKIFLLPAERSGLNLFFRELNTRRAALLRHITSDIINPSEVVKDIFIAKYPQPIDDYIQFLNIQPDIKRNKSELNYLAIELQKKILNARYKIDRYGDISVLPYRSTEELNLHLGSSTLKTFFGLWSYLQHLAKEGDYLMIDEPELNLHPDNQRLIARLLAKLVNKGIYVIVSTHSDYFVREINNLIMLNDPFEERDKLIQQFGYKTEEFLSPEQVVAYRFSNNSAKPMSITNESGIEAETFDSTINSLNESASTIYFTKQNTLEK